jgi:hypothetical protein
LLILTVKGPGYDQQNKGNDPDQNEDAKAVLGKVAEMVWNNKSLQRSLERYDMLYVQTLVKPCNVN